MIKQKLAILVETQMIDLPTRDSSLLVLEHLVANNIINENSQADAFLTHLCMACMRVKKNEDVTQMTEEMKQELFNDVNYAASVDLWGKLNAIVQLEFSSAEIDYFLLHLITLLNKRSS